MVSLSLKSKLCYNNNNNSNTCSNNSVKQRAQSLYCLKSLAVLSMWSWAYSAWAHRAMIMPSNRSRLLKHKLNTNSEIPQSGYGTGAFGVAGYQNPDMYSYCHSNNAFPSAGNRHNTASTSRA